MKAIFDDLFSLVRSNPRQMAFRALARAKGWRFSKRRRLERQAAELGAFELFRGNKSKRLLSMMEMGSARIDGVFSVYDYVYYGDLKNSSTTIYQFQHPDLGMAIFRIHPKGFLASVKEIFVVPDRLFSTTPDFDRRYELHTKHGEVLKDQLNEEFLDCIGDEEGWTFEGSGRVLIAYRSGLSVPVEEVEGDLDYFEKLCERLINGQRTRDIV